MSFHSLSAGDERRSAHDMGRADDDPTAPDDAVPVQPHRRPGRPTAIEQAGLQDTQVSILRQARPLFMQRGFADVSVGEVATLAGVTKPTLYYHFQSKQGLYTAVLCDLLREVGGYVNEVVTLDAPVRERLRLLAVGYLAHARMRMEPMLRDTFELIGQERAAIVIAAYHEHLIFPIANLLRAGIVQGEIAHHDADTLTRAFLGLLDTFTERDQDDPPNHIAPEPQRPQPPNATRLIGAASAQMGTERPMSAPMAHTMPSDQTIQLADLLVSLFLDGAAARPEA